MNQQTFAQPGPAGLLFRATVTEIFEYGGPIVYEVEYVTSSADSWLPKVWFRFYTDEDLMEESLRGYLSTGDIIGGETIPPQRVATDAETAHADRAGLVRGIMSGACLLLLVACAIALLGAVFLGWQLP